MTQRSEVKTHMTSNQKGLVIDVVGFFSLALHQDFRDAFESPDQRYDRYAVNLQDCEGIDSAGLGMLLLLREHVAVGKDDLLITHCPSHIHNILRYSNFDQLFTILT